MELVPPLSVDTKWTWRATEGEGESGTREDQLRLLYLQSTMSSIQMQFQETKKDFRWATYIRR